MKYKNTRKVLEDKLKNSTTLNRAFMKENNGSVLHQTGR